MGNKLKFNDPKDCAWRKLLQEVKACTARCSCW